MARDDDLIGGDGRKVSRKDNSAMKDTANRLRSLLERVERLEEEKKTIQEDIKDVKGEAKGEGFDMKAFNKILKLRKQDEQERMEEEAILDTYLHALGMIPSDDED